MSLRARDVRDRCKGRVDPAVMYCMEALAEQHGVLAQKLVELSMLFDQHVNLISQVIDVSSGLKDTVARMKHMEHEDDLPEVTE